MRSGNAAIRRRLDLVQAGRYNQSALERTLVDEDSLCREKNNEAGLAAGWPIGIYSIALAYLVIVGFASVIPQVFWPKSDDSFDLECADGLQLLRHEVDELRLAYLATNATDETALQNVSQSLGSSAERAGHALQRRPRTFAQSIPTPRRARPPEVHPRRRASCQSRHRNARLEVGVSITSDPGA